MYPKVIKISPIIGNNNVVNQMNYRLLFLFILITPSLTKAQYCNPTVGTGFTANGIDSVHMGSISNGSPLLEGYADYSSLSTKVYRGGTHFLELSGGTIDQPAKAWIDWNQDSIFADPGEDFSLTELTSAAQMYASPITVPITANLGPARMRIGSGQDVPPLMPCNIGDGDMEDYTVIVADTNMVFDSIVTEQYFCPDSITYLPTAGTPFSVCITPKQNDILIMKFRVYTNYTLNPLDLTNLSCSLNGTDNVTDISTIRIWTTGNNEKFTSPTLFSTNNAPALNFNATGNTTLNSGINYFWITTDINGIEGNSIDIQLNTATIDGNLSSPVNPDPEGDFQIGNPSSTPYPRSHKWYFGNYAGLDFNCTPPSPVTGSQMSAQEGCTSVADDDGNLLFYSDGTRIWDRTNTPMPNASGTQYPAEWDLMLSGDWSSARSVIATPVIGDRNRFWIFTTDGVSAKPFIGPQGKYDGLYYTVVDMRLNNGYGDIDTSYIRNLGYSGNKIQLIDSIGEKIVAVSHDNNFNYWIVAEKAFQNTFYAFLVCGQGVTHTPVISSLAGTNAGGLGDLVASRDGKMIVSQMEASSFDSYEPELYDFNNGFGLPADHGKLTTNLVLDAISCKGAGAAFSPNDSILYLSSEDGTRLCRYKRFDPDIVSTEIMIDPPSTSWPYSVQNAFGSMQMGPDQNIYIAGVATGHVGIIDNPNNWMDPELKLPGIVTGGKAVYYGLPNFFDAYVYESIDVALGLEDTIICKGDGLIIGEEEMQGISFSWLTTGDINTISDTNSVEPTFTPDTTTMYILKITDVCGDFYDTMIVTVEDIPELFTSPDTAICFGESAQLSVNGSDTIIWSPTSSLSDSLSTSPIASPDQTTTYNVKLDINTICNQQGKNVTVTVNSLPEFDLSTSDSAICIEQETVLKTSNSQNEGNYIWNNGEIIGYGEQFSQLTIRPQESKLYKLIKIDTFTQCSSQDSIYIIANDCKYYIPNAFSPNGDNLNDYFYIVGEGINAIETNIFDRRGNLVFSSQSQSIKWDGKNKNGNLHSDGIYTYHANFSYLNGESFSLMGNVTLIR